MGQAKEAELGTDSSMRRNHSNNSTVDENSSLQTPVPWNSLPCFKVLSLHSAKHTSLQGMAPLTAAIMTRNPAPVLHSELFKDVIVHANHHTRPRISSNDESDSLSFSNDRGRRWLLQIGGGTDFCQYCRTTLKFDYISIVPGEATQGEMVLCIDAVVASCEAGDSLVVNYVGKFDLFMGVGCHDAVDVMIFVDACSLTSAYPQVMLPTNTSSSPPISTQASPSMSYAVCYQR